MAKPLVLFEAARFRVEGGGANHARRDPSTPSRSCGIRGRWSCCRCFATAASVSSENYRVPASSRGSSSCRPARWSRARTRPDGPPRSGRRNRLSRRAHRALGHLLHVAGHPRRTHGLVPGDAVGGGTGLAGRRRGHPAAAEHVVRSVAMVGDGRIHDAKTMLGLLYYQAFARR